MKRTKIQEILYQNGKHRGETFASEVSLLRKGESIPEYIEGWDGPRKPQTIPDVKAAMKTIAFQAEHHAREFSPFEFVAGDINRYGNWCETHGRDPMAGWDAYEEGIADGIDQGIENRSQEIEEYFQQEEA